MTGVSRNDFWTSGTGTGMANSIPIFWERESKWKIPFPIFGNGNGYENSIPIFGNGNESEKFHSRLSGRELEDGIPRNSREQEREWHHKIWLELSRNFRGMLP